MSIFSKIAKAIGSQKGPTAEAVSLLRELSQDNRIHVRYMFQGDGIAHITLENGTAGLVRDVSYGGIAVRFETSQGAPPLSKETTGRMHVLDRDIPIRFCPVRIASQNAQYLFIGCTFVHDTAETLVFLRDVIEPLRFGKTLALVPVDMRNDKYRDPQWSCFRGDGPTDLIIRSKKETNELEEALLTFREHNGYREVSFSGGRLKTGKSTQRPGDSAGMLAGAQMANTNDLDKQVLRHAAFTICGAPQQYRKQVEPLLRLVLQGLDISMKEDVPA